MTQFRKFVRVVQRRLLVGDFVQGHVVPLIEPLFMIDTHMSYEERMKLFTLAVTLQEGFVACEIGSYVGSSTSFLAAAACLRQGQVHAVDTWKNDAMPGERAQDTWAQFLANTEQLWTWITPHRGNAHDVKDNVPAVDLLFLDGDHSYEGTLADLGDYIPKLKPGGIVAMHDFDYESVKSATADHFKDRPLEDLGMTHRLKAFRPK